MAPSRSARIAASEGVCSKWVTVETMTASRSAPSTPAAASASRHLLGEVGDRGPLGGVPAGDDAGALLDPLVRGGDRLDDLGVGHDPLPADPADAEDPGVADRLGGAQGGSGHRVPPWRVIRSRAAGRSAGPVRATVSTPGRVRRASPVSTPPGQSLHRAGDAEREHLRAAQVPPHRARDLGDQPVQGGGAGGDGFAVGVGQQGDGGLGRVQRGGGGPDPVHGRGHVRGVERPGHRQRHDPGALGRVGLQGGEPARPCRPRPPGRRR